jgi:hypothetical protein
VSEGRGVEMAVLLVKISLFFSKITPNLRLKTLLGWD